MKVHKLTSKTYRDHLFQVGDLWKVSNPVETYFIAISEIRRCTRQLKKGLSKIAEWHEVQVIEMDTGNEYLLDIDVCYNNFFFPGKSTKVNNVLDKGYNCASG